MTRSGRDARGRTGLRALVWALAATACVATVSVAAAPRATAEASEPADHGLTTSSTYTYTIDPAADVVHVVAEMSFTNTVPNTTSGAYIKKTYYTGFNVPVPVGAAALAATQDGRPLALTTEPAAPSVPYSVASIPFARRLFYQQTASVLVSYDVVGAEPRSSDPTRVNAAYAAFDAYGLADPGALTVRVVVPPGYQIDTLGSAAERSVDDAGNTVYTATEIAEPQTFDLFVSARNDAGLASEPHTSGDAEFIVKAWPGDTAWRDFVVDRLDRGIPVLAELIGQPWPEPEPVEISEAVTSYLYGYSGWYDSRQQQLELGEDLDPQTVVHELSQAWFNHDWFEDRWIIEGLAQEYAGLANERLGEASVAPEPVDAAAPGAMPLSQWSSVAITDADADAEEYAYNASWFVVDGIVDDVGVEGMQQVLEAIDEQRISYVGDGPAEELITTDDWQRVLDLVDAVHPGGVAGALIEQYVATPDERATLADREAARREYAALDARGGEWAPPLVVRKQMSWWRFDDAATSMARASEVLEQRDAVAAMLDDLGVAMDPAIERAYETAGGNLDRADAMLDTTEADAERVLDRRDEMFDVLRASDVEPVPALEHAYRREGATLADVQAGIDDVIDAARDVDAAVRRVRADRSVLRRVGLWGTDLDKPLAAAKAALAAGDTASARSHAARARALVADGDDVGRTRVTIAACILGALLVVVVVLILVVRRRRRRVRDQAGPASDPDEGTAGPPSVEEPVAPPVTG